MFLKEGGQFLAASVDFEAVRVRIVALAQAHIVASFILGHPRSGATRTQGFREEFGLVFDRTAQQFALIEVSLIRSTLFAGQKASRNRLLPSDEPGAKP